MELQAESQQMSLETLRAQNRLIEECPWPFENSKDLNNLTIWLFDD